MMERDGRPQGPTTPHPLPARPYYITKRLAKPVYSRGGGGCGCGDGTLVVARPLSCPSVPATTSLLLFMLSYNNIGTRSYTIGDK